MPPMPEHLFKGPILQRLDDLLSGKDPERRKAFLNDLIAKKSVEEVSAQYGVLKTNYQIGQAELDAFEPELLEHEKTERVITSPNGGPHLMNEKLHLRQDWFTPKQDKGGGSNSRRPSRISCAKA